MSKSKGLIILVIVILGVLIVPNVYFFSKEPKMPPIAKASVEGGVKICINTQPEITEHDCSLQVDAKMDGELRDTYHCKVNGTDPDGGNVTYHTSSEFAHIDEEEGYVTIDGNILNDTEIEGEEERPEEINFKVMVKDNSTCPNNNVTETIGLNVDYSAKVLRVKDYPSEIQLREGRTKYHMPLDDFFEDEDGFDLEYSFDHQHIGCYEIETRVDSQSSYVSYSPSYDTYQALDGEPCRTQIVAENPFGAQNESNVFEIHVEEMQDPSEMDGQQDDTEDESDDDTGDSGSGGDTGRDQSPPEGFDPFPPEDPPEENGDDPDEDDNGDNEEGENGNDENGNGKEESEDSEEYFLNIETEGNGTTFPFAGEHNYREGEVVRITTRPLDGWEFDEFSGDCSGDTCVVNMTQNKTVTVNFKKAPSYDIPGRFDNYNITAMIIFVIVASILIFPAIYLTSKVHDHILKKKMEKMKERIIMERNKFRKDYVAHFEQEIKKLTADFDSVTNEEAKKQGDSLLKENEATGYNIDRYSVSFDNDYADILNDDSVTTINYSMYMKDVEHGKRILQELANRGIRANYKLCKRSSAVLWDDDWENDGNAKIEDIGGEKIARTVEYIISFMPKDKEESRKIIKVLEMFGKGTQKSKIKGAWDVPDIRVTGNEQILDYEKTILNTKSVGGQKLMVLTKDKPMEGYKHKNVWLNPELAQFIQ